MVKLRIFGEHRLVCRNPDGKVVWVETVRNGITAAGLAALLQDFFAAGPQKTAWYMGLIDNVNFSALSADDTMSSHAGWQEFSDYVGATRPQWSTLSVAGAVIANTSPVQWTFSVTRTARGIFVASSGVKGEAASTLWSTAAFATARTVQAGQSLTDTYTVRAAGGT
jgi:hypothetical protein